MFHNLRVDVLVYAFSHVELADKFERRLALLMEGQLQTPPAELGVWVPADLVAT
jgi:hypothetical protein